MTFRRGLLLRELQVRLLWPILGLLVITAVLGGISAQRLVDGVFDRWLLDAAQSLARQVKFEGPRARVALSDQSAALLTFDEVDSARFEVEQFGRRLIGDRTYSKRAENFDSPSVNSTQRTYDGTLDGRDVRVAEVLVTGASGASAIVRVSETRAKRNDARNDLILAFLPVVILVVVAAFVLWIVLRRTIMPLEDIAQRWNERSHASLDEIATDDVPRELVPFAEALNDLLVRVRSMLERERSFAAVAAHQLRTPLTGLQLGLDRLGRSRDLEAAQRVVVELRTTTQRMARVINQLLALSRLDPEIKSDRYWGEVNLSEVAHDAGEAYLEIAHAKGLELRLQDEAEGGAPILVKGQADLLLEALGNLLDNAIQYTPPGGVITMTVRRDPKTIAVSDTGTGLPEEDRERIFDRFQRGSNARGEGTGIGLAIVREIAVLHGAVATFSPVHPSGARFEIRFQ